MPSKTHENIRRIVRVGLLIALAVVVRNLSYMLYIGGIPALRLGFSEIFTKIAAILFGPLYGGISSGILDVLGFLLAGGAYGPYIPWLTIIAVLGGIITGLLWIMVGKIDFTKAGRYYLVIFAAFGLIGGINYLFLSLWPESGLSVFLKQIGENMSFATLGLEIIAAVGIGLFLINIVLRKINKKWIVHDDFMKILIATGVSGLIVSTLNTLVIAEMGNINFLILWIPRIIKEVFMVIIQAYIIAYLISIYRKYLAKV